MLIKKILFNIFTKKIFKKQLQKKDLPFLGRRLNVDKETVLKIKRTFLTLSTFYKMDGSMYHAERNITLKTKSF